jgi:UDP-N-acetylglucosamine diphosphorylase/glucosamine-1-phosphate N-acetyltransferase
MKSIVLFEDDGFRNLLPLVFWRSVFELRIGRKIILDRIAQRLKQPIAGVWTRDWIAPVAAQRCGAPANYPLRGPTILINGRWMFDDKVKFPKEPCVGIVGDDEVAYIVCDKSSAAEIAPRDLVDPTRRAVVLQGLERRPADGTMLRYPWQIVTGLCELLDEDWDPKEASIDSKLDPKTVLEPIERIHVGERVRIHRTAVIDATDGPIFIADDAVIGPFSVIEGPLYLGPGSRVNPHAWIHGGNAIGPVCKVGGEICGCVFSAYSNKQHDGFLGHSFVGSWVNIGAGAVNSNLKNTYGSIRVPVNGVDVDSKERFFGAIIGDHAKLGINATIPTGAVIGFGASIASIGPLPKYIPSFSWVTRDHIGHGDPLRILDVAATVMARRDVEMTDEEVELFLELGQRVQHYEARRA